MRRSPTTCSPADRSYGPTVPSARSTTGPGRGRWGMTVRTASHDEAGRGQSSRMRGVTSSHARGARGCPSATSAPSTSGSLIIVDLRHRGARPVPRDLHAARDREQLLDLGAGGPGRPRSRWRRDLRRLDRRQHQPLRASSAPICSSTPPCPSGVVVLHHVGVGTGVGPLNVFVVVVLGISVPDRDARHLAHRRFAQRGHLRQHDAQRLRGSRVPSAASSRARTGRGFAIPSSSCSSSRDHGHPWRGR